MSSVAPGRPTSDFGEPAWEIATLFPPQGMWSEDEYLELKGNHLVEFSDGRIEVLPMPTTTHQRIVAFLYRVMLAFVAPSEMGLVLFAPLRIKLRDGKFREPDILFMFAENQQRLGEQYWDRADLVMEVVSPDDPERDYVQKRADYAGAAIPEYWIVDPSRRIVIVLTLRETAYEILGEFGPGTAATSALLPGFEVNVSDLFDRQPSA